MVSTSGSTPGAAQLMYSVVRPCSRSVSTTRHIGVPDGGSSCSAFSFQQDVFAGLAANGCGLESKITGAGVSPDSLINAPLGVVGSAPRTDLACRLRRRWRSSRLPTSSASQQSWLPYSATAWTQAIWTALMLSGTTPYVFVKVCSLASVALAFLMHRLCCSSNVRCASIQTPSQCVACLLNYMNMFPTFIAAVSFGRRCFWWPHLRVNSAASVCVVSNCSPRLLAHSMLFPAHRSSVLTT